MENDCITCFANNKKTKADVIRTIGNVNTWLCSDCNGRYVGDGWVHHFKFWNNMMYIKNMGGEYKKIKSPYCK